ncbi:MAG: hypothetical protein CVU65_04230 [Deltaproteobacteria bacterium HGW-Deltaproteobacteria-22]|jgi:hypothetical protein|nr:MAG: hypothetical protein CVU65_04230 [Deltaproteobacteria bacterium HGW-Deltaproteobacteria-22]
MRLSTRLRAGSVLWIFPFCVFVTYLFVTPPTADDVWWRLHSGDRILDSGHVQSRNAWAYRNTRRAWVNHAAGHDVIAAAVHRVMGPRGLMFIYILPLIWLASRLLKTGRLAKAPRNDLAWALCVPPLLAIHYALRPYVFSDVFFFIAVHAAVRWHDREDVGIREALPIGGLFLLWGQLHGAVWPGLAFFGLFAVRWRRLSRFRLTEAHAEVVRLRWLVALPAAALANVNHWHGLHLAWRYATGDFAWLSRLTEWQPAGPVVLVFAGVFAGGFVFAYRARGLALDRLLPLLPLAIAGALQIRHLPWLVLGAVALLQGADEERRADEGFRSEGPTPETGVPAGETGCFHNLILWAILVPLAAIPALLHADRLEDPRFHPSALYDQMDARCRLDAPLRVFALHAWGGSLVHHFNGRLAPFLDARNDCFSKETFERYFHITRLRDGWYELLMADHPDGAVLPDAHPLVAHLLHRGWIPGARDGHAVFLVTPAHGHLCR